MMSDCYRHHWARGEGVLLCIYLPRYPGEGRAMKEKLPCCYKSDNLYAFHLCVRIWEQVRWFLLMYARTFF